MLYKDNYKQVMERMRMLYAGEGKDRIFAKMMVVSPALKEYEDYYPRGDLPYPDLSVRADFWNKHLSEQKRLIDDGMPIAYMSEFDEGMYAGFFGAKVRFQYLPETGRVCSMSAPILEDFMQWHDLKFDENCLWAKRYLNQMRFFADDARGKYGISHFIIIDGLNMSIELRGGTNMFLDIMDHPGEMQDYFAFVREVNYWVHDRFFEITGLFEGGTFSNYGQWMPGRIVSDSIDPFHMASVDFFEEWGRDNLERVFAHYDGGCIHIHQGNGKHLIKPASSVKGLKIISIVDEKFNADKAYMHLEDYDKQRGDMPLIITIPYEIFTGMLESGALPGNIFYNVKDVPDTDTANRLMESVLRYRRP